MWAALCLHSKEYGIDKITLIIFTSDNAPHFFDSNVPLQEIKRDLDEGGIRIFFIVRWPDPTPAGTTSDYIAYSGDMMATVAELAGATASDSVQSISIVPTISISRISKMNMTTFTGNTLVGRASRQFAVVSGKPFVSLSLQEKLRFTTFRKL
ncbi:MAG: sulfatase-like hydrolase/transferase [Cyclobacteriaceae bacterium]